MFDIFKELGLDVPVDELEQEEKAGIVLTKLKVDDIDEKNRNIYKDTYNEIMSNFKFSNKDFFIYLSPKMKLPCVFMFDDTKIEDLVQPDLHENLSSIQTNMLLGTQEFAVLFGQGFYSASFNFFRYNKEDKENLKYAILYGIIEDGGILFNDSVYKLSTKYCEDVDLKTREDESTETRLYIPNSSSINKQTVDSRDSFMKVENYCFLTSLGINLSPSQILSTRKNTKILCIANNFAKLGFVDKFFDSTDDYQKTSLLHSFLRTQSSSADQYRKYITKYPIVEDLLKDYFVCVFLYDRTFMDSILPYKFPLEDLNLQEPLKTYLMREWENSGYLSSRDELLVFLELTQRYGEENKVTTDDSVLTYSSNGI